MKISVMHIGNSREPVVVMDGFVEAAPLVEDAAARSFAANSPHYPGVRARAPVELLRTRGRMLADVAADVFGAGALSPVEWNYSLVTTPPEDLRPIQRLPHFDGLEAVLALLVYLGAGGQGGTAFFRQRATGIEAVERGNFAAYEAQLAPDVEAHGAGAGYRVGSDAAFERYAEFEAVPGRALLYRGRSLHSGVIDAPERLSADARRGRLTLNGFFRPE